MRLRRIIFILIKLLAKSCGMKHHLKFDLEKGTSLFPVLAFFDFGIRTEGGS
jgi:hypothetical protein